MSSSRQLRLGAFMRPVSIHTGAWRYPGAFADANFNFAHLKRFAQTLERGKRFDEFGFHKARRDCVGCDVVLTLLKRQGAGK